MDDKVKPEGPELVKNPKAKRKAGQAGNSPGTPVSPAERVAPFKWRPGQSGNPAGRPKTAALSQAIRAKLSMPVPDDPQGRTFAQAITDRLVEAAMSGDIRAAQELCDRAEGKPRQSLEIENTTLKNAFERMTAEEKRKYAESGELPGWFHRDTDEGETVN